jgi:hypothetical protein
MRLFDARNHPEFTAAFGTGFDVNGEDAFEG